LSQSELENFPSLEWSDIASRISPEICAAVDQVLESQDGGYLSLEQCLLLANAEGDDLLALLVAADTLRRDLVGNLVTYVVNRNINFTNVCFVGCKFCAFSRGPREADTYFLSLEQLAQKAVEAWQLGATEVCIQGGLPHELPTFHYRDILRAVKNATPAMHIHAFSPMEIVYGVELTGMPDQDIVAFRNRRVGFVFQFHHLLPEFSALENAEMPMRIARMPMGEARRRARELLTGVGLAERLLHRPGMLSGGEQQRVAVARALVMRPSILLADEPTGDLDEQTADTLHALLRELHHERGLSSVIATHNLRLAGLCDRVLRLESGHLVAAS
jgi:lipoprotein-releasing system ATP-binding protein